MGRKPKSDSEKVTPKRGRPAKAPTKTLQQTPAYALEPKQILASFKYPENSNRIFIQALCTDNTKNLFYYDVMKKKYPQLVIEYFEKNINWEQIPSDDNNKKQGHEAGQLETPIGTSEEILEID